MMRALFQGRKAQIAMFIAIGLVLLGAVGMFVHHLSTRTQDSQDQQLKRTLVDPQKVEAVQRAVTTCARRIALDALDMLGRQGGVIYSSQGGSVVKGKSLLFNYDGQVSYLRYGIEARTDLPPPPNYPYKKPSYSRAMLERTYPDMDFFGKVALPPLCAREGPNRPGNPNGYFSCPVYAYGYSDMTIQTQLEKYIFTHLSACVEPQLEFSNSVSNKTIDVEVVLGDTDILLQLDYPILIQDKMMVSNYTVRLPVRLKAIYQFMHHLLAADVRNLSFHKALDYKTLDDCNFHLNTTVCWSPGMTVKVVRDVGGYDDVLRIQDTKSTVAGNPFIFQVAIENRRPMLDYIYSSRNNTIPHLAHMVGFVGDNLTVEPYGYDPDEDILRYNYTLWAETEKDMYAHFCSASFDNITSPSCVLRDINSRPHRWTTSPLYSNPSNCGGKTIAGRCASITLSEEDKGTHQLRVAALDDEGLEDYQVVNVVVSNQTIQ